MTSMAEQWFHYGESDEFFIVVILAPDTIMILFIDGSCAVQSMKHITIYESCWLNSK